MVDLDTSTCVALTNLIGGAESPSWSREGDRLVFVAYEHGGWDVAVVKDPLAHFADVIESGTAFPSIETEPGARYRTNFTPLDRRVTIDTFGPS